MIYPSNVISVTIENLQLTCRICAIKTWDMQQIFMKDFLFLGIFCHAEAKGLLEPGFFFGIQNSPHIDTLRAVALRFGAG